jgi:iron complex outermembrane recepter protein
VKATPMSGYAATLLTVLAATCAHNAVAQDRPPAASHGAGESGVGTGSTGAGDDSSQLQEIVVTATRREESLEKVPISVSALTQSDLTEGNIKSIADVAQVTPARHGAIGLVPINPIWIS